MKNKFSKKHKNVLITKSAQGMAKLSLVSLDGLKAIVRYAFKPFFICKDRLRCSVPCVRILNTVSGLFAMNQTKVGSTSCARALSQLWSGEKGRRASSTSCARALSSLGGLANGNKELQTGSTSCARALSLFGALVFVAAIPLSILLAQPQHVDAQTSTLNFQGRLLTDTGSLVPDGDYNIEFKLYDSSGSGASAQGACVGGATDDCVWVETRTGGNQVTIRDGYYSVYLGDVTSLPDIDWSQPLWLTMNIGGTGAPSWDGEMSPRFRLTSVPYAFTSRNVSSDDTNAGSADSDNVTIQTGDALGATSDSGDITIDVGTATQNAGSVSLGATNASAITIGNATATTTLQGPVSLTGTGTALTVTNNAQFNGDVTIGSDTSDALTVEADATFNGSLTISTGDVFTNAGATLFGATAIGNLAAGGNIGTAATTVDVATTFDVNQTTAGQTLTLPDPTNTASGRVVYVNNIGSQNFTMYGETIETGSSSTFIWNGSSWTTSVSFSNTGVDTIGALDGGVANANGAEISGTTLYLQSASATQPGLINTTSQAFAGVKTFNDEIIASGGLTVSAGENFVNQGSTLFDSIAIADVAAGGNIGTAATTVDVATTFDVNQTTAGQTLTLPNPTTATSGRIAFVNNVGSASFTMYGSVIAAGQSNTFIWNGSTWITTVSLSGSVVNTIGTIDSQTKSADGAVISANAIYLQTADIDDVGLVSIGNQTFNGVKTFDDGIVVTTGGATITAGDLAVTAGDISTNGTVRLSNAGALSSITGYSQNSGNFAIAGTGTFSTGTGTVSLNGATSVTGTNTFTVGTGVTSLGGTLGVTGAATFDGNVTVGDAAGDTLTVNAGSIQFANNFTSCTAINTDASGNLGCDTATYLTSANAFVQGGNAFGATAQLGTTDAESLELIVGGQSALTVADGGAITVQNETDSTAGFQILDADGGTAILTVDTQNERVGIGTSAPVAGFEVATDVSVASNRALKWNAYYNGANDVYLANGSAVQQWQDETADFYRFYAAAAGTAGNPVTFQEAFAIDLNSASLGDVTFDSGTLYVDASANAVNIGNSGTLTVAGLTTLNGGLTVEAGDTFTFNGDGFTDFTGGGLYNNAGVLSVTNTGASGFFQNGGNLFGTTATLGTNDGNPLVLRTNSTTALTIDTSQNITTAGNLDVAGRGAFGNNGSIGTSSTVLGVYPIDAELSVEANITVATDLQYTAATANVLSINPAANPANQAFINGSYNSAVIDASNATNVGNLTISGVAGDAIAQGSGNIGIVEGGSFGGSNYSTGTVSVLRGSISAAANVGGNVTTMNGAQLTSSNFAASTVTNANGANILVNNSAGGTITNAKGVNVRVVNDSGTITSGAGVVVESVAGTNTTNLLLGTGTIPSGNYSIYNASTADNYFAGRLVVDATAEDVANGNIINIAGNLDSTTQEQIALLVNSEVNPGSASTRSYYGTVGGLTTTSTNLSGAELIGMAGGIQNLGTGTIDLSIGVVGRNINATTGTLNNSYALYAGNVVNPGGTVVDNVGLLVEAITGGTGENAGIAVSAAEDYTLILSDDIDSTTAAGGITFGSSRDTNLYRSGANELRTDDSLVVNTNLTVNGNTTLGDAAGDTLTVNAGSIQFANNFTSCSLINTDASGNLGCATGTYLTNSLTDNITDALDIQEGTNNYININTTDSSEEIQFGNATTNPDYSFLGSGSLTVAGPSVFNNLITQNAGTITNTAAAQTINFTLGDDADQDQVVGLFVQPTSVNGGDYDNLAAVYAAPITGYANTWEVAYAAGGGYDIDYSVTDTDAVFAVGDGGTYSFTGYNGATFDTLLTITDAGTVGNVGITGTLQVEGLTTLNGGLTVEAGDTFTFNSDAFTDFTGGGLVNTGGVLSVDTTSATGFFRNGGNDFGGNAILGTNTAGQTLAFETADTTRFTISSTASTLTGNGATSIIGGNTLTLNAAAASALDLGTTQTSGVITIGGTGAATGAINLGTGSGDQTINLATGSGSGNKTVSLGATNGSSSTTLRSGSGGIALQAGTGAVSISGTVPNSALGSLTTITGTYAGTSDQVSGVLVSTAFNPGSSADIDVTGILSSPVNSNGNLNGGDATLSGVIGLPQFTGAGSIDGLIGIVGTTVNSGGGTAGFSMAAQFVNGINTGTVTRNVGVDIGNFTGGTFNTNLLIGTTTAPAGDYSIYNSSAYDNYFAGALEVDGLVEVNGGLTVEAGDTFTFNSDAFTDFTGGGLVNTGGVLSVDTTSASGFFQNGGNDFGGTATLGTNDANSLVLETNNQSALTIANGGAATFQNNTNSTSAFQVVTAATGTNRTLLNVDTTNELVTVKSTVFDAATVQAFTGSGNITQSNIDGFGTILISSDAAGYTATLQDPTSATAGRLVYVTNTGSFDMTLAANSGGTLQEVTLKPNTSATMVWNGSDWTAAGASSSTDLQAAYNNTATSAGGAELILNAPGGAADGLTVRNNATTPITGGLLEIQTSIGSNLFSVNNNATEFASNGGAETAGASAGVFPSSTWSAPPTGGTVSRFTTTGDNVATGQASVQVVTAGTDDGAANQLASALTPNLEYTVSFTARGLTNFSSLEVVYSRDGTNGSTTACTTGETVTSGQWTRITCTFAAPSSGITSANEIFIRQTDGTARTFYIDNLSVNINASATYAADGSVDDSGSFATNWTNFDGGAGSSVVSEETSVIYDTSASAEVATSANANQGIRNNLAIDPATDTQYLVSFYARADTTMTDSLAVGFLPTGGTSTPSGSAACTDYNTQSLTAGVWTKITCLFTTTGTTVTNPDLVIYQTDSTARSIFIDALSITLNTNNSNNVQVGGGNLGGPVTLFTLDRSAGNPIADNNEAYLGSMYYDTITGRIQCYEADGWGACGAAPDNVVNLNPEYAGAVLNGSGVGTMTADFCSNDVDLSVNSTFCGSGEAKNFYNWTSPQATEQTYSIYVTYQLPETFNGFSSDDTVQLVGRVDNTSNASVTYEMFRSTGSDVSQCGTGETDVITGGGGSADTWYSYGINGNESTGCGLNASAAGDFIIFKINLKAQSNANAYVSTLSFVTTGR